jgi:hypothetical protein
MISLYIGGACGGGVMSSSVGFALPLQLYVCSLALRHGTVINCGTALLVP